MKKLKPYKGTFNPSVKLSTEVGDIAKMKANLDRLINRVNKEAIAVIKMGLYSELSAAMQDAIWAWPRQTKRRNGSTAGTIRSIVDTNTLNKSLTVVPQSSNRGFVLIGRYRSEYATQVHDGAYIRPYGNPNADTVFLPGRPWVEGVLFGNKGVVDLYDIGSEIEEVFLNVWKQSMS